jgi:hypothetical protein
LQPTIASVTPCADAQAAPATLAAEANVMLSINMEKGLGVNQYNKSLTLVAIIWCLAMFDIIESRAEVSRFYFAPGASTISIDLGIVPTSVSGIYLVGSVQAETGDFSCYLDCGLCDFPGCPTISHSIAQQMEVSLWSGTTGTGVIWWYGGDSGLVELNESFGCVRNGCGNLFADGTAEVTINYSGPDPSWNESCDDQFCYASSSIGSLVIGENLAIEVVYNDLTPTMEQSWGALKSVYR